MPGVASTGRAASSSREGGRGGGWVAVQVVLIGAIFLSALARLGWSGTLAPIAWTVGGIVVMLGAALLVAGGASLGSGLRTSGIYGRARHPMCGGGILVGLGRSTIFATPLGLALTVLLAVFADLKSRREER
jgi:protein-S-isoprenylcysteine O-methyltransferase Ste14